MRVPRVYMCLCVCVFLVILGALRRCCNEDCFFEKTERFWQDQNFDGLVVLVERFTDPDRRTADCACFFCSRSDLNSTLNPDHLSSALNLGTFSFVTQL